MCHYLSIEDMEHKFCSMAKAPFEYQIVTVLQVLVYLSPSKLEAPEALWLKIDKAMERLHLATLSVSELQELVTTTPNVQFIQVETTMPNTTF